VDTILVGEDAAARRMVRTAVVVTGGQVIVARCHPFTTW